MQIKSTMRYHLTMVTMAVIKKTRSKCWEECGEKGNVGGNGSWCIHPSWVLSISVFQTKLLDLWPPCSSVSRPGCLQGSLLSALAPRWRPECQSSKVFLRFSVWNRVLEAWRMRQGRCVWLNKSYFEFQHKDSKSRNLLQHTDRMEN